MGLFTISWLQLLTIPPNPFKQSSGVFLSFLEKKPFPCLSALLQIHSKLAQILSGLMPKQSQYLYSATSLVRPKLEELIPEKNSLEKIPKPLKRWMGRPQLLPEIVENVLRSLWWGNGSKQPSPCLQPPKVGGLLRHLLLLLKAPLTSLHF